MSSPNPEHGSPWVQLSRTDWAALARTQHIDLGETELASIRGLGDPTDMSDVEEVYLPLCQLIQMYVHHQSELNDARNAFLATSQRRTPFVIGIAGSVAVGKSTTSRLLQALLALDPRTPKVDLITTDGFLYPNAELEARGIADRKGFPESYNARELLSFVTDVKSGVERVEAPVYSHMVYDIVPGERIIVESPDILIVEGLNVLQPGRRRADGTPSLVLSDFFDFSVYVDAAESDIQAWFTERFMTLRRTAFTDPTSFFKSFTELSDDEALSMADQVWRDVNGRNLALNIQPTKPRATAILRKGSDHRIKGVRIRKI